MTQQTIIYDMMEEESVSDMETPFTCSKEYSCLNVTTNIVLVLIITFYLASLSTFIGVNITPVTHRMHCEFVVHEDGTIFVPRSDEMALCLFFKDASVIVYRYKTMFYCNVPRLVNNTTMTLVDKKVSDYQMVAKYNCILDNDPLGRHLDPEVLLK